MLGLGMVWYGIRSMSILPPHMEIGMVPDSHMWLVMFISSMASVWDVLVTMARNRSEVGRVEMCPTLVRPRPLPRWLFDGLMLVVHGRREMIWLM